MWRYRFAMPDCEPITLGEGYTPLVHVPRLAPNWYIKNEALNPTGSFKDRGMSMAVSMARKLGATGFAVPSAGNAAAALSAYAAAAGIQAHVFMPRDTPQPNVTECRFLGARVTLVDGLITDCAQRMQNFLQDAKGWFDLSTLKEPYRVEGKKTMGYEILEQLNWKMPDAIVYPTGGGTGLIGMWKAFDEIQALGWIGSERPKMICVQADGCRPIVTAFQKSERFAAEHKNAQTKALGLQVPRAIGDFIILDILRASEGTAIAVSDDELLAAAKEISNKTGIFACPEGGATLAAARRLLTNSFLKETDTVILFNTASALKYVDVLNS